MARYTNAELADMCLAYEAADVHLAYEAADCSGREAQWLYAQRYQANYLQHFLCTRGFPTVVYVNKGTQQRERTVRTPPNGESVLWLVQNISGAGAHAVASHVGISHTIVWRILYDNEIHPYHISAHCYWTKAILLQDYPYMLLFTDTHKRSPFPSHSFVHR